MQNDHILMTLAQHRKYTIIQFSCGFVAGAALTNFAYVFWLV